MHTMKKELVFSSATLFVSSALILGALMGGNFASAQDMQQMGERMMGGNMTGGGMMGGNMGNMTGGGMMGGNMGNMMK